MFDFETFSTFFHISNEEINTGTINILVSFHCLHPFSVSFIKIRKFCYPFTHKDRSLKVAPVTEYSHI